MYFLDIPNLNESEWNLYQEVAKKQINNCIEIYKEKDPMDYNDEEELEFLCYDMGFLPNKILGSYFDPSLGMSQAAADSGSFYRNLNYRELESKGVRMAECNFLYLYNCSLSDVIIDEVREYYNKSNIEEINEILAVSNNIKFDTVNMVNSLENKNMEKAITINKDILYKLNIQKKHIIDLNLDTDAEERLCAHCNNIKAIMEQSLEFCKKL